MSATGQYFSKHKQGILPRMVEVLYSERVEIKQKMLAQLSELELVRAEIAKRKA
jgi:DNA polymerase elongation subunit (family B)